MPSRQSTLRRGVRAIRRGFRGRIRVSWKLLKYQRELRDRATDAEKAVMAILFHAGLDYQFQHIVGDKIVDFKLRGISLAIEVDGGYHETPRQGRKDLRRPLELYERFQLRIVRCTNEEALRHPDIVLHRILSSLTEHDREDIFCKCLDLSRWFMARNRARTTGSDTAGCVKTGDGAEVLKTPPAEGQPSSRNPGA